MSGCIRGKVIGPPWEITSYDGVSRWLLLPDYQTSVMTVKDSSSIFWTNAYQPFAWFFKVFLTECRLQITAEMFSPNWRTHPGHHTTRVVLLKSIFENHAIWWPAAFSSVRNKNLSASLGQVRIQTNKANSHQACPVDKGQDWLICTTLNIRSINC